MLSHLVVDLMFICICPIRIYSNLKLHTFVDMSLVERGRSRPSLSEGVARRSAKRSIFRATLSVATRSTKGSNRWSFIVAILRCFSFRDKLNAWHIVKCMGLHFLVMLGRSTKTAEGVNRFGCFQGDLRFSRGTRPLRSLQRQNCLSKTLHRQPVAKRRRNISGAFDFVFRSPV